MRRLTALAVIAGLLAAAYGFANPAPRVLAFSTPLGVGERLSYNVSFSFLRVGSGEMSVVELDSIGSHPVWHAVLVLRGGIPFFSVNDSTSSWFDTASFSSRRFTQRLREGRYHADRDFRIDPERRVYTANGGEQQKSMVDPLDDVSFVYFLRTLTLTPDNVYTFHRYFRPEGNPVVIRVIRRERITVPAGTFNALLIEPRITTQGIFSENGRAQLWLSDDSARVLLQLKSKLSFGSINLYLKEVIAPHQSPRGASTRSRSLATSIATLREAARRTGFRTEDAVEAPDGRRWIQR